jgi:hypothetical protein
MNIFEMFEVNKKSSVAEAWSQKYKSSINCSHPKGFSQKAHCAGKKKQDESVAMEMVCESCGMCETHGNVTEIKKGQKDSNGVTKCWPGKHAEGTKKGRNGGQVRNCVPNEGVAEDRGNSEVISKNKLIRLLKIAVANSNDRREYTLMTQAKEMFGDNWADDAYEYAALHNQNLNSDTFLDANNEEMQELADRLGIKHSDYSSTPDVAEADLNEVTGDLPFDTMLSKIVAGGNLQTLAAKIVAKIKKFPQYVENDGYERDMPRYPDGHFYGADVLNDTFGEVMQQWKKIGPDNFSDEYGEESLFDVLDGSADYTRYWDGILKLRNRLQSMPGAVEQLGKMVWHGLFSGSVEQGITDIGRKGVAENWGEPLTGWHVVYARTGNKVSGTPNFDSRDSAQKYLMTKMSANHHNYRVADADNLGTSAPTPMGGYLEENDDEDQHGYMPTNLKLGAYRDDLNPRDYTPYPDEFKSNEHLREIVYDMVEKGVKPKLVVVSPRRLTATQDWLADDRYRDDGSVFEEYADHPVVLTLDGEAYILDGHHRCSGALTANRNIKVYVFGSLVGVAEGEPIQELSSDALDRYKVKAKQSADELTSQGKYRQANDRTMNVMKATGKQIDKTVTNIRNALNRESTNQGMAEDAEQLNVGDDVIISGDVQFNGATGVIDSFGRDHRFVVVNLYNHGRHSFHSSDVSFNDYADSDDEQARMYDAGEFRGHTDDDVMEGRLQQMRAAGYDIL